MVVTINDWLFCGVLECGKKKVVNWLESQPKIIIFV